MHTHGSPDGALVAHATPGWGLAIIDAHTLAPRVAYEGLGSPVNAIAWAPDGASLFTLGADGRITQWPVLEQPRPPTSTA